MGRVVFLTGHLPAAAGTQAGEKVSYSVIEWLAGRHDVWLVAMTNQDAETTQRYLKSVRELCREVVVERVGNAGRLWGVLSSPASPIAVGARWSSRVKRALEALSGKIAFDAAVYDHTQMLQYAGLMTGVPKHVLLAHDVLYQAWERKAAARGNAALRWAWGVEARRVRGWESSALGRCGTILVLSEKDRRLALELDGKMDVHVIAPRLEAAWADEVRWEDEKKERAVVFWGSMQRVENMEGAVWFAEEVLPLVRRTFPDTVMYVVGARPGRRVSRLGRRNENVVVTGFVADPRAYFERCPVAVASLRTGAGVKIKVLESMKAGIAVVGTEVAAEGIGASSEEGLIVENGADGLARRVVELLGDRERAWELGQRAREFVTNHYDWGETTKVLDSVFAP